MRFRLSAPFAAVVAATIVLGLSACGGSTPTSTTSTTSSGGSSSGPASGRGARTGPGSKPPAGPYAPPKGAKPDPDRSRQYGLDEVDLPQAWHKSAGQKVVIAIVDTGVDLRHPDLRGRLVPGHDFVTPGGDAEDGNGHGTHVAGIAAAATDNGIGISGGAPEAKIMPVRVLDDNGQGSSSTIAKGIEWAADHGAKVINLSLGESGLAGRLLRGGTLNSAIARATRDGAVVVAAAGNDGSASKPYRTTTPVLVVGAVNADRQPASFSNFGAEDAVTAPGVQILSTLPTYSTKLSDEYGKGYGSLDGTSMAAPYVSAIAALLVAQGRTPQQVIDAIQATAKNPDHIAKLGLGIVDAKAAVDSPKDIQPPPQTSDGSPEPSNSQPSSKRAGRQGSPGGRRGGRG